MADLQHPSPFTQMDFFPHRTPGLIFHDQILQCHCLNFRYKRHLRRIDILQKPDGLFLVNIHICCQYRFNPDNPGFPVLIAADIQIQMIHTDFNIRYHFLGHIGKIQLSIHRHIKLHIIDSPSFHPGKE